MVKLVYFLRTALGGLRQSFFVHAVAALAIGVSLLAMGLSRFAAGAVGAAVDAWGGDVEITAYLKDAISPEDASRLAERLRREERAEVKLVGPEEALARLARELGGAGQVLDHLPKNPLPASLELRPAADSRSAAAVAVFAGKLQQAPEVASVEYGRDLLERLQRLSLAVRWAGALLLALVLLAALVVVSATLQLAIYARRAEIEIQQLVGATDTFVKVPFLIEGAFQGLMGAAVAALGLLAISVYVAPRVGEAFSFLTAQLPLPNLLEVRGLLELAGLGVILGLLGSIWAVRRFMRL